MIEREKRNACIIIMGNWNVVVGEGKDGKEVGKRQQKRERCDNGEYLQREQYDYWKYYV